MVSTPSWLTAEPTGSADRDAEGPGLRVMLVEDNPGDIELVRIHLRSEFDPVEVAQVASLAEAQAEWTPGAADVVLLDLGLPDATGMEVVRRMRGIAEDVPIVVLTGENHPEAGVLALQNSAQDYLMKTHLTATTLSRSIRYALERHRWQMEHKHQLSVSPDGVLILDEDGEVKFANSMAVRLLGRHPQWSDELPKVMRSTDAGPFDVALPTGRTAESRSVPTVWQGAAARLVTLRDTTERRLAEEALTTMAAELREANERLGQLVNTDPLTDALNRRGIEQALARETERNRRTGDGLVAILIDCDDFRAVNSTYGHAVGDAALEALTWCARESLRLDDHFGRVGGDQFLVLLPATSAAQGVVVAEKLRRSIKAATVPVADGAVSLSASLSVTTVGPDVVSLEQVLARAADALRRSKEMGKDRVSTGVPGSPRTGRDSADGSVKVEELPLTVALQTIRSTDTEEVLGYEALLRGPEGSFHLPADIFRAAQEQGSLTAVDLTALSTGLTERDAGVPGWYHVNVLPSTILNTPPEQFAKLFGNLSSDDRVCLELSEQQFLGDPALLREPLEVLREAGVLLAIDDVGFGRSSIEALLLLEPDIVKVDRRCVRSITSEDGKRRQLQRLLQMLHAVCSDVVVEGVETSDELAVLREVGVRYAQGFYWDRPTRFEPGFAH